MEIDNVVPMQRAGAEGGNEIHHHSEETRPKVPVNSRAEVNHNQHGLDNDQTLVKQPSHATENESLRFQIFKDDKSDDVKEKTPVSTMEPRSSFDAGLTDCPTGSVYTGESVLRDHPPAPPSSFESGECKKS